jgi:hypothetical protein
MGDWLVEDINLHFYELIGPIVLSSWGYCKNAKVVCPSLIGFGSGGGGEEVNACARGQKNLERSQLESQLAGSVGEKPNAADSPTP